MTEGEARHVLTEQGYTGLRDFRPMDGGYAAQAMRDGQPVTVVIDADGIIHTR